MAPEKRKSAFGTAERQKANGVPSKKLKVDAGRKQAAPAEILDGSDDLDESNGTESDGFGGFSEDGGETTEDVPGQPGDGAPKRTAASKANGNQDGSSRESHAKQKALAQDRKAAKPNADITQRSKKIWERLRLKSHVPLQERKQLVAELFEIVTGRVRDFVLKHDAVRVIQTAIKYANLEQRKMIGRELKGEYKNLAESRYAKFLIGKLLVHGDAEIRDTIVPEFYGHVRRMIKHPEASWILDDIYRGVATPQQKANLLREWYGSEYSLFKTADKTEVTSELLDLLTQTPEKRAPIMRSLHELINQLVQKKMTGFTMLHDAMLEYLSNVKPGSEELTDFLELLKGDEEGDLLKNLAFTKSGARVVCLALAYGSAKDRKHILRQYKDLISMLAFDAHGHLIIITAYEVVDDTVLTSKTILPELFGKTEEANQENILNAVSSINARIPLLYLPAGRAKWLLTNETIDLLEDVDAIRKESSKKEPAARRQELLEKVSPPLLKTIENDAKTLCQSSFGWQFIGDVLIECVGPKARANEAVAEVVSSDPTEEGHPADLPAAGRTLKTLVAGGKYDVKAGQVKLVQPTLDFDNTLFASIKPFIASWATGPSSFVILGMLDATGFLFREELLAILKKNRKALSSAAKGEHPKTKPKPTDDDEDKAGKKRGKEMRKKEAKAAAGNKGAVLILEKCEGK